MRILVVTAGSWGDILPFVPPATALQNRGHDVVVAVPPIFTRSLRRRGLRVVPAGPFLKRRVVDAFHATVGTDDDGAAPLAAYWTEILLAGTAGTFDDLLDAAGEVDVLLAHYHSVAALALAERTGIPRIALAWGPACLPSAGYPPPIGALHVDDLPGALDPVARTANETAWASDRSWAASRLDPATNEVLAALGASPVDAAPFSVPARADRLLLASHPALLDDQADWPSHAVQVGYPYSDAVPGTGTAGADAFLDAGEPPVLVSFGTAIAGGAVTAYRTVVRVLRDLGRRVLVLGPDLGLEQDRELCHLDFAPISGLVGRCRLVVHHGGPGTSHAVAVAGVPAVVIPQFLDQPLNAAALARRGAAVALRPWEVDEDSVRRAVEHADGDHIREQATRLGEALAADPDPAEAIATAIEAGVSAGHAPSIDRRRSS